MKKKIIIAVIAVLLVAAGVISGILLYKNKDATAEPTTVDADNLVISGAATAFSFLSDKREELPDNMRGYVIDTSSDIDMSSKDKETIEKNISSLFDKVDAILPNTVIIKVKSGTEYNIEDFDFLEYLLTSAKNNEMFVIIDIDSSDIFKNADKLKTDYDFFNKMLEYKNADGIMIDGLSAMYNKDNEKDINTIISELKSLAEDKSKHFGLSVAEKQTEFSKNLVTSSSCDFFTVTINSSLSSGAENSFKTWSDTALNSASKMYCILRNDLVLSNKSWTDAKEISNQVRQMYNEGGFSGCVMSSHSKLASNDNETTVSLYSYNEYFNDVDYTALDITGFSVGNDGNVTISGTTSDTACKVLVWCTSSGKWTSVKCDKDGKFSCRAALSTGVNKVMIKHKNALYTYKIDNVVDVMTAKSTVIDGSTATLTATAYKGAKVYASLANTTTLELSETSDAGNGYCTFTATYDISDLAGLKDNQVSFAAVYAGLSDIVMCNEESEVSPYNDNGLGRVTMCIVTKDYAETSSENSKDDTSDPTCTPQLKGSIGYVQSMNVYDNKVIFTMNSGMKTYASDATLIVNGFKMPDNSVSVTSLSTDKNTVITIKPKYLTVTRTTIEPQDYYKGYLERLYNVKEFNSQYINFMFYDTAECSTTKELDFTSSSTISKAEWYRNNDENITTLRLYLKKQGAFYGYSMRFDEIGNIVITINNDVTALDGATVMLDAGHGGYGSPGTSYNQQVYEKDVTLAITKKVQKILTDNGVNVIMTRTSDESVFLDERVNLIRSKNPDVYVSIHCDGADSTSWTGTHTFYYKNFSMPLAKEIHTQMVSAYRNYYYTDKASTEYASVDKNYKFFPYMVTRVEVCPSVLVECGYLTNTKDCNFMTSSQGQDVLATAIAQGIINYILNH